MLDKLPHVSNKVTFASHGAKSLPEVFRKRARLTPEKRSYMIKKDGAWVGTSWKQFYDKAAALAGYLIKEGLQSGESICIMGSTKPEWVIADMGGQLAGCITVGAYPTLSASQLEYILDHSDTKIALIEGAVEAQKLYDIKKELGKVQRVLVWNYDELPAEMKDDAWFAPFESALATPGDEAEIQKRMDEIKPDDTAIIVYTSGTTGPPKGAMISQSNITHILHALEELMPVDGNDVSFNFLPMAHVAERIAGFYLRIDTGISCAYATSVPAVLDEIKDVHPTLFGSVPRIFEKAYAKIQGEVSNAPEKKQKIFRWAERIGRDVVKKWQAGEPIPLGLRLKYKLVDKLVFSKIREVFGGNVKHFLTGAAPINYEILEFFWAAGFPIFEVYGMTEATVITHANRHGSIKLSTVGKPIPGVEERLADDGEILLRGPTVFKGYYKNPDATAEAIDSEGWLHTGDIGRKDSEGFLKIVDRKKHIIITSGGKNITPANIEQEIKGKDALISQVHAHGDRRSYLTAIVTIHPMEAIEFAKAKGLVQDLKQVEAMALELMSNPLARPEGLDELMGNVTQHDEIKDRIVAAVRKANRDLAKVETIKKIYLLERDFSPEEDELTPTMKVKRKNVEKKFEPLFDRLYAEKDFGFVVEVEVAR